MPLTNSLAKYLRPPAIALALATAISASAQTSNPSPDTTDCHDLPTRVAQTDCTQAHMQVKTIYLTNVTSLNDANEILVAVRNMFEPADKIYLLASKNAIVIASYPAEIARIAALVHELDTPRKTYSLTFTLKDASDSTPAIPPQHFTIDVADGQRITLKQGSKFPVITGTFGPASDSNITAAGVQTQYTYLDIGINFDVTLTGTATGAVLKSKIEQSAIASEKSLAVPRDPIVRQTVLDGVTALTLNKPAIIGSIDIPGTTRRSNIEVVLQQVP